VLSLIGTHVSGAPTVSAIHAQRRATGSDDNRGRRPMDSPDRVGPIKLAPAFVVDLSWIVSVDLASSVRRAVTHSLALSAR